MRNVCIGFGNLYFAAANLVQCDAVLRLNIYIYIYIYIYI